MQIRHTLLLILVFFYTAVQAASVDTISVRSRSMNKNVPCVIVKPDSYKKGKTKYPVVYLLHGYGGKYKSWVDDVPSIKEYADLYNLILIAPNGGKSSWYWNSPVDSTYKYETFVSSELVSFVDSKYRTIADRNHRAITGYSMGGHGAFYLAIRHKDVFGAAGAICGGVDIRPFPERWEMKKWLGDLKNNPEYWNQHTVINVVNTLKDKELELLFDCGIDDFFLEVNRDLHRKLLEMKISHEYTERPGGHNVKYWGNAIAYHLLFFRNYFTANPQRQ